MSATTYTDQQQYIKFLHKKACQEHSSECGCEDKEKPICGCCPAGLVSVYDDKSQQLACLTPNDAELFKKNTLTCQDGYVKLIVTATGEFLGCVSEAKYAELYAIVNPG